MKNSLFHLLTWAINGLKDLTDPARQGSPYDLGVTYEMTTSKRKLPFLRRKMVLRI
ncbi:hypothetical protein HZC27_00390 [Candidatus Roizmanbacteria bacterium]|nr:hypothetical protein [Candidatus Roizmanbacteria bacterium]